jgi:pimeloyl-ACP methyl ester carboxylesterase
VPSSAVRTVFVPGLLCSARLYEPLLPTAWAHGPVTVADTRRDDSIAGMAARLLEDAPSTFVLVGVSMGGYVALEVVRRAPDRVAGLALLSTSARPDSTEQLASRARQSDLVRAGQFDALVEGAFDLLPEAGHVDDVRLRTQWRTMAHDVGAEAFLRQQQAVMDRADARPGLGAIACPTSVIHGSGDRLITPDHAEETAAAVPDATLTLVANAGHLLVQEQPVATAQALEALLTRL